MRADSQPFYPRYHKLTVADILTALKDQPPEAVVRFRDGGYIESDENAAWREVHVVRADSGTIVQTCWE